MRSALFRESTPNYKLLGVERADKMIDAVCAGEKCHVTVMEDD